MKKLLIRKHLTAITCLGSLHSLHRLFVATTRTFLLHSTSQSFYFPQVRAWWTEYASIIYTMTFPPYSSSPVFNYVNCCFSVSRKLFPCIACELRFNKFDWNIIDNFPVHCWRHFRVTLARENWITSSVYDFAFH